MGRSLAAVVTGYVVMFAFVFLSFSAAFLSMGTDRAFMPDSFEPSTLWLIASFVLGFVAAVAGGLVCALIAKHSSAGKGLAGLVIVLGLAMAIPVLTASPVEKTKKRDGSLSNTEAMMNAQQPAWVALVDPFLGAVGVLAGARLRSRRQNAVEQGAEDDSADDDSSDEESPDNND